MFVKSLHLTITLVLAGAVAILSAVLIRSDPRSPVPETDTNTVAPTVPSPRIERMSEFEGAMNKLGYQAWGFRWYGGTVDATIRFGMGDKNPTIYDGKSKLDGIRRLAATFNEPAAKLNPSTGSVLVVLGPLPEDKRTIDVPCRVLIELSLPSGESETTEYKGMVDYASPHSDGDSGVFVAGRWIEHEESKGIRSWSSDPESAYRLLELRWLPDSDPPQTQNKAVNPSGGSGGN